MTRFPFQFATPYRLAALPFGVMPSTAEVRIDDGGLRIRFGPWKVETPLDNVVGCTETGPYRFVTTAGPARVSLTDRGLTCATNGERGLCIRFDEPVPGIEPTGRIRHPAVTVTVQRPDELAALLDQPR